MKSKWKAMDKGMVFDSFEEKKVFYEPAVNVGRKKILFEPYAPTSMDMTEIDEHVQRQLKKKTGKGFYGRYWLE
jgi:hypothetical protein